MSNDIGDIHEFYPNDENNSTPISASSLPKKKEEDFPIIIDRKTYKRYGNEYPLESYNNGVSRLKYQEDYNKIKQEFKNNNNIDKDDEKNPILRKFKKTTKGPLFIATKFHGGKIKKSKKTKRKSLKKRRKTKRKSLKNVEKQEDVN